MPDAHRGGVDPPHGDYPFSRIRDKLLRVGGIVKQIVLLALDIFRGCVQIYDMIRDNRCDLPAASR
jgi:hypothetical protein